LGANVNYYKVLSIVVGALRFIYLGYSAHAVIQLTARRPEFNELLSSNADQGLFLGDQLQLKSRGSIADRSRCTLIDREEKINRCREKESGSLCIFNETNAFTQQ